MSGQTDKWDRCRVESFMYKEMTNECKYHALDEREAAAAAGKRPQNGLMDSRS